MTETSPFSANEWERYSRHIQLPQFGAEGQLRLKQSKVLIVGTGGLGSPAALYLAAAGVGELGLLDDDTVDLSNLQRQILFRTEDIALSKVQRGAQHLRALNSEILINVHEQRLDKGNAEACIGGYDLILDCSDNISTRYALNDACLALGKPWLYASVFHFSGQLALFTDSTACYRCLFPQGPALATDCNSTGILGVLPGLLGVLQACEALKWLAGLPTPSLGKILLVDALSLSFQSIAIEKNSQCHCQNENLPSPNATIAASCHTHSVQSIDAPTFARLLSEGAEMLDVRSQGERAAYHIGGRHLPLEQLATALHELPKTSTYLCYCQSGLRSEGAAEQLSAAGLRAFSLTGGLAAWAKFQNQQATR